MRELGPPAVSWPAPVKSIRGSVTPGLSPWMSSSAKKGPTTWLATSYMPAPTTTSSPFDAPSTAHSKSHLAATEQEPELNPFGCV